MEARNNVTVFWGPALLSTFNCKHLKFGEIYIIKVSAEAVRKNTVSIMLCRYQLFCGWSGQVMIDQMYLMLFNLLFTSLPPVAVGVFDRKAATTALNSSGIFKEFFWEKLLLGVIDIRESKPFIYYNDLTRFITTYP